MSLKTIIMPFMGHDDETAALETAFALAKKHRAHLDVLHVTPGPYEAFLSYAPGFFIPPDYPEQVVSDFMTQSERLRDAARLAFTNMACEMRVETKGTNGTAEGPSAAFTALEGNLDKILVLRARLADLIVMSRATGKNGARYAHLVRFALFRTGCPVLLAPPGYRARELGGKVMVAWNGSHEAARAAKSALPLMAGAQVRVFTGKEGAPFDLPNEALVAYLRRHGIEADQHVQDLLNEDDKTALDKAAKAFGAGLLVMGAYSRENRIREAMLGSLTAEMLDNAEIPVLMAC